MAERYGIVYMGSKEKILHLIRYIIEREYEKKYFIDLFCGGLSVTSYVLQHSQMNVIANDLNKYVIALYREILDNNSVNFDRVKYEWVSREKFNHVRDFPDKYEDWYVGYVLNVWSFGCNQNDYLYAKDLEENKHAIHQAIVFNDFSLMKANPIFDDFSYDVKYPIDYKKHPAHQRIFFMKKIKQYIKNSEGLDRLQHLERLEQMENLTQMEHINVVKRNIPFKERLSLYSADWKLTYEALPKSVLENAVIYCDPPYEGTKQYQFGKDFNYEEFWDWFRKCPYSVYVSSYKAPDDIEPINYDYKNQLLDNGKRGDNKPKKKAKENIYWNGKGNPEPTLFDLLFGGE